MQIKSENYFTIKFENSDQFIDIFQHTTSHTFIYLPHKGSASIHHDYKRMMM